MVFTPGTIDKLATAIDGRDWWDYRTADTIATVEGVGYFNAFAKFLGINDKILVQASDNIVQYYISAWTVPVDDQGVSFTTSAASVTIARQTVAPLIASGSIANALLANMAQATVKGRQSGAGTGVPQDLVAIDLINILGIPANIRVFTSSGTYPTVTNASVKVLAYCKGGGGGGGGATLSFGGGGGEGAESWKLTTAGTLSALTVTVGGAGSSVAANTANQGGTGGTSSIGTIITAPGGVGGYPNGGGTSSQGGAGGSGGTKDYGMPGDAGQSGGDTGATIAIFCYGGGKGGGVTFAAGVANSGGGGGNGGIATGSGVGGTGIVTCIEFGVI